jgi:L-lactate dehydrogenase complex protein LldF
MKTSQKFLEKADKKAFDLKHRKIINFNIDRYDSSVLKGKKNFSNLELARQRANFLKHKAITNLDQMLLNFESAFTSRGGKVIWASTAEDANKRIADICKKHKTKSIVKSKSMVTEEIHLNDFLTQAGIKVWETDLGEFIVQVNKEAPYHIITPAMHLSKEDIAEIYHKELNTQPNLSPEEITAYTRELLRPEYLNASIGITGANFIVADTGSIVLTENEGNARLSTSFPKVHIAIVGIEKVIPSLLDLDLFLPLLSIHGTGQLTTVYNSIISGPRQEDETDGPDEMYVILLDNGRTNILADKEMRESLYCIRCGACLNACPVYKNIGGHTYGTTYSGPIGSVITPTMKGMEEFKHLSYASSLCGKCTEVCPVRIDLHKLLLFNRNKSVKEELTQRSEVFGWRLWRSSMLHRSWLNKPGGKFKRYVANKAFSKVWGNRRSMPTIPDKSFNQLWREKNATNNN